MFVTDYPGSKPDQRYAQPRDTLNYIRKIRYKSMTSSKINSNLVQYFGTLGV